MAKRRPVPPHLTLPDDSVQSDPQEGWMLVVEGQPDRIIPDKESFPSWDSSLKFALRRRYRFDTSSFSGQLDLKPGQARYQLVVRLETAGGMLSEVCFREELAEEQEYVDVVISPDSKRLSRNIALAGSIAVSEVAGDASILAPSAVGSRVWTQVWSSKLEGGQARLPIEVLSFSRQLPDLGAPKALMHVSVADSPELEFEDAVCVYLNADHPHFVSGVERGEPAATVILWDAVVRQVLSSAMSATFADDEADYPEGSVGAQIRAWMAAIFPRESPESIAAARDESPGLFEARIQSWVNAGALWAEVNS